MSPEIFDNAPAPRTSRRRGIVLIPPAAYPPPAARQAASQAELGPTPWYRNVPQWGLYDPAPQPVSLHHRRGDGAVQAIARWVIGLSSVLAVLLLLAPLGVWLSTLMPWPRQLVLLTQGIIAGTGWMALALSAVLAVVLGAWIDSAYRRACTQAQVLPRPGWQRAVLLALPGVHLIGQLWLTTETAALVEVPTALRRLMRAVVGLATTAIALAGVRLLIDAPLATQLLLTLLGLALTVGAAVGVRAVVSQVENALQPPDSFS